jgi:hypothetical protein
MTTLALPATPASPSVLIVSTNEYLDARAHFAVEFSQAEASGLVKWMPGSQGRRRAMPEDASCVHIDPAAGDVILSVKEFQEQQRRNAAILGKLFPVPSPEPLKIR